MLGLMAQYLLFLPLFLFLHFRAVYPLSFNNSSFSAKQYLCLSEESLALLRFKNSFSTNNSSISDICLNDDPGYPKTESWKESTDCCSWDGVTCDRSTGHVIGLDLSYSWLVGTIHDNNTLFLLRHLRRLNFACNDFSQSKISTRFGGVSKLIYLNFSLSNIAGPVPAEISHLPTLVSLDLSYNSGVKLHQHTLDEILKNVTQLRHLHLDSVDMSSIDPGSLENLSISLISLSLRHCKLQGKFPDEVFHLPLLQNLEVTDNEALTGELPKITGKLRYLKVLRLSWNNFTGQVPISLSNLEQLTMLQLNDNKFSGELPNVFGNLSRITHIDLSGNNFFGQLPSSIFNITQLSHLDFSTNPLLSGPLPHQINDLPYLTYLDLSHNSLTGQLPPWLFVMPSLEELYLGGNTLTGTIKQPPQINSSLSWVDLSNNELYGPFPSFLFELNELSYLSLSSNKLSGFLPKDMFSKLKNLNFVDLSGNSLSITSTANVNFTLPNLISFRCASCNLTRIPSFLIGAKNLEELHLHNNSISGHISSKYNNAWTSLNTLDLSSNMLQGPLFDLPHSIQAFSVSQNKLMGGIPSSFCNLSSIKILDLSNNTLSGTIPKCLLTLNKLFDLNLGMNNFTGSIPQPFSKGNQLNYLILNDNQLEGPLPQSLINCTELEVLDVRNNKISDTFPHWLATLHHLQVLVLQSNKFHGTIGNPHTRLPFPKLQILDISHNKFTGLLPTAFFENFKAMMYVDGNVSQEIYMFNNSKQYQLTTTMKGIDIQTVNILNLFKTIDLSSNQFEGPIPEAVGNLNSLKVLNFSHNQLIHRIPHSLGNLTVVESLDLSSNNLAGEIPRQLTLLNWLSVLNISYNQLVGPIPQGPQFNTFDNSSYIGNLGLCGLPLSRKCGNNGTPEHVPSTLNRAEEDDIWEWFWEIVIMGYGSGFVIGVSVAYMVFTIGRPFWIMNIYERLRQPWIKARRPRERRRGGRRN